MTKKEIITEVFKIAEESAMATAIQAMELMSHIKERPCDACEFHKEKGCCVWTCVFDEWLKEYVYGGAEME